MRYGAWHKTSETHWEISGPRFNAPQFVKTFFRFVSSILLPAFLAVGPALCQTEQDPRNTTARELPFRLSIEQEETPDGATIKLKLSNETDFPVMIDQKALLSATPSILIDEKTGGTDGTKLTRFISSRTYSDHPLTREQILKNPSRAITVKPRTSFEVFLPPGEVIQAIQKQSPDHPIAVRFFISKLILAGKFSKLTNEDLFALRFSSNILILE